jgi:hypothetical protein
MSGGYRCGLYAADGNALYMDRIEIEAGVMTLPVWLFANVFYRYRQMKWRKLLRSLKGEC